MSNSTSSSDPKNGPLRFGSLAELRAAHNNLYSRHDKRAGRAAFLTKIEEFIQHVKATGALLDADADRTEAQHLLDYWLDTLYRFRRQQPDERYYLLDDFDPTLEPPAPSRPPYLGLNAFDQDHREQFFGRKRLVQEMLDGLQKKRLLVAVGPSGSGKSSVVLGGLLPALEEKKSEQPEDQSWEYYPPMVPGSDPLANLARMIQPVGFDASEWVTRQREGFLQQKSHLARQIASQTSKPAILVVDQFEEVFTLCADDAARQAFITNLLVLTLILAPPHIVILSMRSDFESYIAQFPRLQRYFEQTQVRVMPLNAGELREAIEKPAELVGWRFEEGLVDELLQNLRGEPAELPLLQFTLLKLWELRTGKWITWDAYRSLGRGREALARSADDFYEQLSPADQAIVKRLLLRMVRVGEELDVTSNRVRRADLRQESDSPDEVDRLVKALSQAQLVRLTTREIADDIQIELAHETLVRNWPRLVGWVEEERVALRRRQRLTANARQWDEQSRPRSGLLDGPQLEEAIRYRDLSPVEREFVDASLRGLERRLEEDDDDEILQLRQVQVVIKTEQLRAEEQARFAKAEQLRAEEQARFAKAEQLRAEEQTRFAQKLRRSAVVLACVSTLAIIFAIYAWVQKAQAQQSQAEAQQSQAEAQRNQKRAETEAANAVLAQATSQAAQSTANSGVATQQAAEAQAQAARATAGAAEGAGASMAAIRSTAEANANIAQATAEAAKMTVTTSAAFRDAAETRAEAAAQEAQALGAIVIGAEAQVQDAQIAAQAAIVARDTALSEAAIAQQTAQAAQATQDIAVGAAQTAQAAQVIAVGAAQTAQAAQAIAEGKALAAQAAQAAADEAAQAAQTAQANAEATANAEAVARGEAQTAAASLWQTIQAIPSTSIPNSIEASPTTTP